MVPRAGHPQSVSGRCLQLDARGLPDWVYIWEDDFESLLSAAGQFIEAAVKRYRGKVDLWHCAAKANTSQALKFSDEERLRLVAWIVCRVRQLDPEHPLHGRHRPALGEYLGRRATDLSPLQFADALVRARIELRAILLDMNFGLLLPAARCRGASWTSTGNWTFGAGSACRCWWESAFPAATASTPKPGKSP